MHRVVEKWPRGVAPVVAVERQGTDTDRPQHPDMAAARTQTAAAAAL